MHVFVVYARVALVGYEFDSDCVLSARGVGAMLMCLKLHLADYEARSCTCPTLQLLMQNHIPPGRLLARSATSFLIRYTGVADVSNEMYRRKLSLTTVNPLDPVTN